MLQSGAAAWDMVDLSPKGLAELRAETSQCSAPGCATVQSELGVRVDDGEVGGVAVQWVRPSLVRGKEVILYFFGGGFVSGSAEDDISITARLADHCGRRVCVPRYRLAPENPFPCAADDAMIVYRALCHDDVVIVGESAGGNLALGLALGIAANDLQPPKVVALLSPWIDLTHSGDSHATLQGLDPTLSVTHFLEPASLAYAGGQPRESPGVSPLFADIPSSFAPTIISSATRDLLLSDSVRLAAKLRAAGATVDLQVTEGLWHVFEWYPELPESVESMRCIASFVCQYLAASNSNDCARKLND